MIIRFDDWSLAKADAIVLAAWNRFEIRRQDLYRAASLAFVFCDAVAEHQTSGRLDALTVSVAAVILLGGEFGRYMERRTGVDAWNAAKSAVRRGRLQRVFRLAALALVVFHLCRPGRSLGWWIATDLVMWVQFLLRDAMTPPNPPRRKRKVVAMRLATVEI